MSDDTTIRMVRNLDRAAVERKLADVRKAAQAAKLAQLVSMLTGIEGMPKAEIRQRVMSGQKWLADKPQHKRIAAELELVELNLKNLK